MHPRYLPLFLALLAGCTRPPAAPPPSAEGAAPVQVAVVRPERKALPRIVEQPGTVEADEETPLYAKLAGFVKAVRCDIGDRVKGPRLDSQGKEVEPGQVLAEIAIPEMEDEARHKEALVEQAAAEVEQAKKALAIAEAGVAAAEATAREAKAGLTRARAGRERWESEARRIEDLVKNRVIDRQTRDETVNQLRSAEAAFEEAQARVLSTEAFARKSVAERDKAAADVTAAAARLKVARAEAARLQTLLGYTKVRAPFDGVVTRRRVDTGHFVQPVTGGKAEPLFTVTRLDPVRIAVDVPEADAALVAKGAKARVAVQALGGPEIAGTVARTSEALQPGARTLRAEIDLPNPDGRLRPGMYVYARITVALPEAWVLPSAALARQGETMVCFLVTDGKAVRTPVQAGRTDGTFTQVIRRQRPDGSWEAFRGSEEVAGRAAGLSDGQAVAVAAGQS